MCPHFVEAIKSTLADQWTQEMEDAYNHTFNIMSYHMKTALIEQMRLRDEGAK